MIWHTNKNSKSGIGSGRCPFHKVDMNMLLELFLLFFKLGAFTIGGGVAMLPLLQNTLIEEKKWFTKEEFMDIVAVTQSLPGVIAINMATYVGYKKKGLAGSIVSTIGVVLPSFVLILIMANGIASLGGNSAVKGAMAALRATALGLIIVAVIQLAPAAIKSKWAVLAAAASFAMIVFFNVNTAYVILLFIALGIASALIGPHITSSKSGSDSISEKSESDTISEDQGAELAGPSDEEGGEQK